MDEIPRFGTPGITLAVSVGCCVAVGLISGLLTRTAISGWYATLVKPWFNPPNWIFGPVWTALYILMGVAAWMVWQQPVSHLRTLGLACFVVQLALNFLWSLIFFRWHSIGGALIEIVVLWLAIVATHVIFFHLQQLAGELILPYLAWVSFAAVLNAAIFRLNR